MDSIYKTHTGLVRNINQDYGLISQLDSDTTLVIVADGMGGHKAGEVASKKATEFIKSLIEQKWPHTDWEELLSTTVQQANDYIYSLATTNSEYDGMGTTVEVGLLSANHGLIAHVGDSRVYLLRGEQVNQLTEDHSLVYELYKSGQISLQEIESHPQKNLILRALGTDGVIKVDIITFSWDKGDRILFCTDGLFKQMKYDHLASRLQERTSIHMIAEQLMQAALELGGDDNITFAIVENAALPLEGGECE